MISLDFRFFLSLDSTVPGLDEERLVLMEPWREKLSFFDSALGFARMLDRKPLLLVTSDIRIRWRVVEFLEMLS